MNVFTGTRRIVLYWLLLLLPTLAVGGGAILLLRREQERIVAQSADAIAARQAAVEARAQLIVETVELLVGDVEAGLLDLLAAESGSELDAFMDQMEKTNPLVRTAFRAAPDGRMLRPDARSTSEDARGFLRRFARQFGNQPPWQTIVAPSPVLVKREQDRASEESPARQDVSKNVAQVQSARRGVQDLLKSQNSFIGGTSSSPATDAAISQPLTEVERERAKEDSANAARLAGAPAAKSGPAPALKPGAALSGSGSANGSRAEGKVAMPAAAPLQRAKEYLPDRRGWTPVTLEGRLNLFGWLQPGGTGEVRGVEVESAALISRLAAALPAEPGNGEGYALRDDQGRVLHQAGAVPRSGGPIVRIPFAASVLPGWDIVAFLTTGPAQSSDAGGFLGMGFLLVGIFVAAILTGGSLLLWQARRSQEEAAQKTSFVANVSHEFKTPLTTIRLYSELLEQGRVRDQAQGGEYLRTIGRETQRLARLVNNALDFSRLEQGRKKYARESVDLTAELGRLLDTHTPRVAEAGLVLHRELPKSPLQLTTDRDAVEQIVLNLIDNACKYAADGGEVTVSLVAGKGGGAEVCVADRGPGVPVEHRERIFEKFHRVDDALTAEKTGAGLGLSIARQLARGLGGELRYVNRAGTGAAFVVKLP